MKTKINAKNDKKIMDEVFGVIEGGREEIKIEKKAILDNRTNQFSIKIPKGLSLKSGLNKESEFVFVFNPKNEETIREISNSGLVIYLKEVKDGETGS